MTTYQPRQAARSASYTLRFAFPLPEVDGFNRNNYNRLHLTGDKLKSAREKGISNLILSVRSEIDGYDFKHRLNLYGFRGDNFAIDPPTDRSRVLFIGDSFVEGMGADENATIPKVFSKTLQKEAPIEAINLGVSGIGFAEYVRIARDAVPLLHPKSVFLVVFANDLPAPEYAPDADLLPSPIIKGASGSIRVVEVVRRLCQGKPVPRFFFSGPYPFFEPVPSSANPWSDGRKPPDGVEPRFMEAFRRGQANPWLPFQANGIAEQLRRDYSKTGGAHLYIEKIDAVCRNNGTKLVVVYIPFPSNVNSAYLAPLERIGYRPARDEVAMESPPYHAQQLHLREVTSREQIPFIDLTEEFILAEKLYGPMFWGYDNHCNAAGYRVVALACARYWNTGTCPPPDRAAESLMIARSPSPLRK